MSRTLFLKNCCSPMFCNSSEIRFSRKYSGKIVFKDGLNGVNKLQTVNSINNISVNRRSYISSEDLQLRIVMRI